MSSIRAYIRTQSKSNKEVKVRFLLIDGKINLSYVSEILINPLYWDSSKQGYNNSKHISPNLKTETDNQINKIKYLILSIYNSNPKNLTSKYLTEIVNQQLQTNNQTETPNKVKTKIIPAKIETTLIEAIDFSLKNNDISYKRKQTYKVVRLCVEKYIYWKKLKTPNFSLTLENTTVDTLWELEKFFLKEPDLNLHNKKIKKIFPRYKTPSLRATNTVIGFMRILRAVFNFAIKHEMTNNYPFRKFKMKEAVFGTPFYPTREELKILNNYQFEDKILSQQRDIYIFQCQVGMRINDLYQLNRKNINNGILEYIPDKTKRYRVSTITIPLNPIALEILERYSENERILPFVCEQYYNRTIKKVFTIAGLTRPVTLLDPLTNEEVVKPLNEIVHSHAARKYFCAALFEQVKDQTIVAELSGHSPNSVAFQRYRNISFELKKSLTDNIF